MHRIGVLNEAWAANHPTVEGLRAGLRELGFEEGRDVAFDIRFTQGKPEATPAAAEALVKAGVDLIFTSSEAATQAAKSATQRIPIVFTLVGDPVTAGIVRTIAQARRERDRDFEPRRPSLRRSAGDPQDACAQGASRLGDPPWR